MALSPSFQIYSPKKWIDSGACHPWDACSAAKNKSRIFIFEAFLLPIGVFVVQTTKAARTCHSSLPNIAKHSMSIHIMLSDRSQPICTARIFCTPQSQLAPIRGGGFETYKHWCTGIGEPTWQLQSSSACHANHFFQTEIFSEWNLGSIVLILPLCLWNLPWWRVLLLLRQHMLSVPASIGTSFPCIASSCFEVSQNQGPARERLDKYMQFFWTVLSCYASIGFSMICRIPTKMCPNKVFVCQESMFPQWYARRATMKFLGWFGFFGGRRGFAFSFTQNSNDCFWLILGLASSNPDRVTAIGWCRRPGPAGTLAPEGTMHTNSLSKKLTRIFFLLVALMPGAGSQSSSDMEVKTERAMPHVRCLSTHWIIFLHAQYPPCYTVFEPTFSLYTFAKREGISTHMYTHDFCMMVLFVYPISCPLSFISPCTPAVIPRNLELKKQMPAEFRCGVRQAHTGRSTKGILQHLGSERSCGFLLSLLQVTCHHCFRNKLRSSVCSLNASGWVSSPCFELVLSKECNLFMSTVRCRCIPSPHGPPHIFCFPSLGKTGIFN